MKKEKQKNPKNTIKNTDETTSVSATQIPSLSVKQITFEKLFVFIAVLIGSLLVFLTPPLTVPDENTHFVNAYAVSKGNFFADVENGQIGIQMPQVYVDFINGYRTKFTGKLEEKQTFTQYYYDSWLPKDMGKSTFFATSLRNINPIGYLVSGFGMALGGFIIQLFSAKVLLPYNLLLFGRIFNLMFYIIVTYYAIKITPKFKRSMVLLSLMPMSIFLAASLSYDAVIIPVSFLLFAYAMKLITSPAEYIITKKDIMAVMFIAFFLGGVKAAYLPFLLILLAVPRLRFGTIKRYLVCIGIVTVTALAAYAIPAVCNQIATKTAVVDTKYIVQQKEYLSAHAFQFPFIILNTFKKFGVFYLGGFFGILGCLDTNFPIPVLIIFYLVLIFVMLMDSFDAGYVMKSAKLLSTAALVICVLGLMHYMYINWTSQVAGIGVDYVTGVQGRYYIPVALFVFILFSNSLMQKHKKLRQIFDKKANCITFFAPAVLGLLTVTTVLLRFWG